MAGYKIQLKDKNGNRQYPVTTTNVVVDADGVSVADLLDRKQPTLASGVNIKTINGKTLLGEGDLVIEGGTADLSGYATTEYVDAKVGESYPIYYSLDGVPLTEEQKAANKMAIAKYAAAFDSSYGTPILYPFLENRNFPFNVSLFGTSDGGLSTAQLALSTTLAADETGVMIAVLDLTVDVGTGDVTINYADVSSLASHAYVDSKIQGGGGTGEAVESDVICVVWDDDTSDIPSNKEAYQKLAESINTVGKPAAVMVCVETGYRWGIAKYYWKSNVGGDIELTTPVTESGLYCVFTLTSEGVCTASYKQVDLGGGSGLKYFVERYVYAGDTEEERTYNLESLAMLEEGADILWAGTGGLQPNYEYGSMWGYMTTLNNYYGIFAKVEIDSETGALVIQTVEFIRDFYFAQGSEMKVLAANFFKIEGWMWESAFYLGRPILYWHDGETDTMVNAYFLLDGLRTAYVSINIETGEVGSPVPVQSN